MIDRYASSDLPAPPQLPPSLPRALPSKSSPMKPLFWSVAILIGLAVMCGGGFMALMKSRKGLEKPTRGFLRLFQQGKYEDAYALWASDAFKEVEPKEKTVETLEMSAEVLGELKAFTPGAFRIRSFTGKPAEGYIEYAADFSKGKCQIIFTLQQKHGEWKINSYKFNSTLFNDYLRAKIQEDKQKEVTSDEDEATETSNDESDPVE